MPDANQPQLMTGKATPETSKFLQRTTIVVALVCAVMVCLSTVADVAQATSTPRQASGYLLVGTKAGNLVPCTAFVVQGVPNKSVIATAGHCAYPDGLGTHNVVWYHFCPGPAGFVRRTDDPSKPNPYQCKNNVTRYDGYMFDAHVSTAMEGGGPYDFAFIKVHPATGLAGQPVAAYVDGGGLPIKFPPDNPYNQYAAEYGFSGGNTPVQRCPETNNVVRRTGSYVDNKWSFGDPPAMKLQGCDFVGGASGGPWVNANREVIAITSEWHKDCSICGTYNSGTYMGNVAFYQLQAAGLKPGPQEVDDTSPGFAKGGPSASWYGYNGGHLNHFWWTYTNGSTVSNYATWTPNLPADGVWQVQVFVPAPHATTTNARYVVTHNGQQSVVPVNQNNIYNDWVTLGYWYFPPYTVRYARVALDDATNESPYREIGFDAVRFIWIN